MGMLPLQWDWVEGKLIVTAVAAGTVSVSIGDSVVTINGRPAAEALAAREELISGATPQWIRYRGLQELLLGATGGTANLSLERNGQPQTAALRYGPPAPPLAERRPNKIAELESGIFYVDVSRLSEAEFIAAYPQLFEARGIVFDFRGYPTLSPAFLTHLSTETLTSAQWHVPSILLPDRQNLQFLREGEWSLRPTGPYFKAKKVFITDGRAISYAESCLGIIENYQLGTLVGAASAGTNGNANTIALPGRITLAFTGMRVLKHDGTRHHGVGIQPTVPVTRSRAAIVAGRDEFLERAVVEVKRQLP
jgi:C-terminal processing protease CtpA/Prc